MNDARGDAFRNAIRIAALIACTAAILLVIQSASGVPRIMAAIERAGPWAPVLYVAVKSLFYIAAPLSSVPLQLAAAALFGLWPAAAYTLIGAAIGGSVNFWLARRVGRPFLRMLRGGAVLAKIDRASARLAEWPELLVARVFFSHVYDVVSYAAGLTKLPYLHYLFVSVVGGIVPTVLWAAVGASMTGRRWNLVAAAAGVVVLLLLSQIIRRRAGYREL